MASKGVGKKATGSLPAADAEIIELLDASLSADFTRVRRIGNRIAAQLSEAGDLETARRVKAMMRKRGLPLQASGLVESLPVDGASRMPLIEEQDWPSTPVLLSEDVSEVFVQFLDDAQNSEMLSRRGLSPRLSIMFSGDPGTGKSLLAGHIAARLKRPFYVVRLDSLISSRLGETAKNIRAIFDFVSSGNGVLFLDEMDAIAKLRDDRHELGELKRVVNTVIQGLDALPPETIIVGATNHPHLLDPAIWRRFPYRVQLSKPDADVRCEMWRHFLFDDGEASGSVLRALSAVSSELSGADIENIALAARRQSVIDGADINVGAVAQAAIESQAGTLKLPKRGGLSSEEKRSLVRILTGSKSITKTDAASVVGVSRQMVARYLKDEDDG